MSDREPIDIGLVISIPAFGSMGRFEAPGNPAEAIRVQMETLGGQCYFVSLSVAAARNMLLGLANWPPMQDFLSGQEQPEPPKRQ